MTMFAVAFAVGFLWIVAVQREPRNSPASRSMPLLKPFEGKLNFRSIDDLRVDGRKILLCGAAFTKPRSLLVMVTEAAKRDYQALLVRCRPVGTGTPCDGNVASRLGDAVVVQCFTYEGADLAMQLTQKGLLCGQAVQAGAAYKPC